VKKISIVIPALEEELRLPNTLNSLNEFFSTNLLDYSKEVIIVVPDSKDRTYEIAKDFAGKFDTEYKVLQPGEKVGKGRDVRAGMLEATGDIVIFMDADLATPLHHLNKMVALLDKGTPIVIGIRQIKTIHHSKLRSFVSLMGNLASKFIVNVYYEDTQCGFKGFTKEATQICFGKQTITGWGFDIELLAIAGVNQLKVDTIVIEDWDDVAGGSLNDSVMLSSFRTITELLEIRANIRKKLYS